MPFNTEQQHRMLIELTKRHPEVAFVTGHVDLDDNTGKLVSANLLRYSKGRRRTAMTAVSSTVLLRDIERADGIRALDGYCARRGYERVANPSLSEPHVMRASVQTQGRWTACVLEQLDEPESLARPLSKALGCLALASWYWEDESVTCLTLFERAGKRKHSRGARPPPVGVDVSP